MALEAWWKTHGRTSFTIGKMLGDTIILAGLSSITIAYEILFRSSGRTNFDWSLYLWATSAVIIGVVTNCARSRVYDVMQEPTAVEALTTTTWRLIEVLLGLTGCLFILKISDTFSRFWLVAWGASSGIALAGFRLLTLRIARRLVYSGKLTRNVAVIGANEVGRRLATQCGQDRSRGARLVGMFDQDPTPPGCHGLRVQGMKALDTLLAGGEVDEIIIALSAREASERIAELLRDFHPFPVSVRIIAPLEFEHLRVLDNQRYGEINTFLVARRPLDEDACVVKWIEDKVLAALCLLAALPLMLFIGLAIKLDSRGPILFRQQRWGANNQRFGLLKFRLMYADQSDPFGRQLTRSGDPRITRVGRILRSTSLDELPQLINVLRGDMSIVGPRPHALEAHAGGVSYAEAVDDYRLRHRVKPGITGWAQVNGWRGETTKIEQLQGRINCDLYYVENWSLMFDFVILGRTVLALLSRQNAV